MLKKNLTILLSTLAILIFTNTCSAKVDSVLIEDQVSGDYLEYSYDALIQDYTNNLIGKVSPLYDEYIQKTSGLKAFKDSIKGYISSEAVVNDYTKKLLAGRGGEFNIDNFTEQASNSMVMNPNGKIRHRVLKDNTVQDGSASDVSDEFDVDDIN